MSHGQDILVIGYGNELRGDDALGPCIVRALEREQVCSARMLTMPQLMPELAAELAQCREAIFIDASIEARDDGVSVTRLSADGGRAWGAHVSDPGAMLAIAELLYGRAPNAWLVTVTGATFEPGCELSPTAVRRMQAAVDRVQQLIQELNAQEAPL